MPIVRGEWYHQSTRPMLKYKDGAVTADVEQSDVASCAVTSGSIALAAVKSEHASTGLRRRSVSLFFKGTTSTEAAGVAAVESTALVVWRPSVPINVVGFDVLNPSLYGNATCDNLTLYGNEGTCIGHVPFKSVSTGVARGTRTAGSGLVRQALAADTNVLAKLFTSTCSQPADLLIQLHYESTA